VTAIWHVLVHYMGVDYGLPYGRWGWYNFHSGFGANFGEYAIAVSLITLIRKTAQHHQERIAQSARQHRELLEQAKAQHDEAKAHLAQHLAAHCTDLKEHISAAVPQEEFERRIHLMMRVNPQAFDEHFRKMSRREGGRRM
jgi:hypothetical protein